jgi:tRNA uridine 5-carboxymethylaminomethyl modification enzyme
MVFSYDVIVIGGGHAGCEAAHAAARLGARTCLITMDMNKIGQMSCNPAVGGIAKGQIVREIDALGGKMGEVTDACSIQFRMLNRSKGPAMWSPRSQADRGKFIWAWRKVLENTPNLSIWQDTVKEWIFVSRGTIGGVVTRMGVRFEAKTVVLTAGTFLNGLMHIGRTMIPGGRVGEEASYGLTEQLVEAGITMGRMKTGTPVRIDGRTINFEKLVEQPGDENPQTFSYLNTHSLTRQRSCYLAYTNLGTHEILRTGFDRSPLYTGRIQGHGPRYCPSIEDKIVRFAGKDRHQLFVEPEGWETNSYYLNGFSSSLPLEVQVDALHTIEGFEDARILKPGYAIEYDYFPPTQLKYTL